MILRTNFEKLHCSNVRNILITGANGFIGRALCDKLLVDGYQVKGAVRDLTQMRVLYSGIECGHVGDIGPKTDWSKSLSGIDCIVHLAACVHLIDHLVGDSLKEYQRVNTDATLNLARQAVSAGVQRFVFVSTIKVNGEATNDWKKKRLGNRDRRKVKGFQGAPFSESDLPNPHDAYAVSKWEAEKGLRAIAKETGLEVVIIRPPLVYGHGVKANFSSLMKWVRIGVPLPLGAVHNKRSFVALDNLVSFIVLCIGHPKAVNEVFLISDGEDLSTTELLYKMSKAFGKRPFFLPVPVRFMTFVANLLGKRNIANRLFGSLQLDSSKARELLGWKPVVSMDEGLRGIVAKE